VAAVEKAGTGRTTASRYLAWLAAHTAYGLSDIEAGVAARAATGPGGPTGEAGPSADQADGGGDPVTGPDERPDRDPAPPPAEAS
jgi:hypothetical protein